MENYDVELDGLDISPEEMEARLEDWRRKTREEVKYYHTRLSQHIRDTLNVSTNQRSLRTLSWTHSQLLTTSAIYRKDVDRLLDGIDLPIAAASSVQDAYHQTHFINACILTVTRPDSPTHLQESVSNVHRTVTFISNQTQAEADAALEQRLYLYTTLARRIPNLAEYRSKLTLKDVYRKLEHIEQMVSRMYVSASLDILDEGPLIDEEEEEG